MTNEFISCGILANETRCAVIAVNADFTLIAILNLALLSSFIANALRTGHTEIESINITRITELTSFAMTYGGGLSNILTGETSCALVFSFRSTGFSIVDLARACTFFSGGLVQLSITNEVSST